LSERALSSESVLAAENGIAVEGPGLPQPAQAAPTPALSPPLELWFKRRIELRQAFRDIWRFRELILSLAERDYRARYKQAVLGVAWAMLTPVLLVIVFTIVFTRVQRVATGGAPYVLFSYLGLIPWTFFSGSVTAGGQSIVTNMALVNKVACPREVFPLAAIAVTALDAVISSAVLIVLFGVTGYAPRPESLYVPLLLLVLLVYTLGTTLIVSAALVYLRDLRLVLPLVIQLGLFLTPIAYGINVIARSRGTQLLYSFLDPVAPVVDSMRRTVLYGLAPDWQLLGMGTIGGSIVLVGGYLVFKRLEVGIADIA
jgi:ABC-2 type transport system permease protein/lipopolysaccharide transport system permease protein